MTPRRSPAPARGTFSFDATLRSIFRPGATATYSFDATLRSIFRPGATATYSFDASAAYDAIQIATQLRQVIGGSASFDVSAHATVTGAGSNNSDKSFDVRAVVTFHADHAAYLVLDASQHYALDLTTGAVVRTTP